MNRPEKIENLHQLSVKDLMEDQKTKLIILDGSSGAAYLVDTPEYGKTIIQTANSKHTKLNYDYGFLP
ncbi:hypothetical protein A6g_18340 [Bacillus velezensis]|uniref:XtrA/YqaO family protein n=1 Tax=Bacillus velezensis TaxID=492670 RepID=UPI00100BCE10|nr:XtrA/YqaO family protein [Bacillus velezensis]RXK26452.1 hypothetical protein A6g_18340 [Bacillus velezensis]